MAKRCPTCGAYKGSRRQSRGGGKGVSRPRWDDRPIVRYAETWQERWAREIWKISGPAGVIQHASRPLDRHTGLEGPA